MACVVAGACALTGCGVGGADGPADAESAPAATAASDAAPPPTTVETTTSVAVEEPDAELVAACVEYVQFQAYVGDAEGRELWTQAGETAAGLDAVCRSLVLEDEDAVASMRDELADTHSDLAEVDEAAMASTTLAPGCHPSYGDCLPIVSDIDCLGDRDADGPVYQPLSVLVFGNDEYELDGDDDGLACEPGDR